MPRVKPPKLTSPGERRRIADGAAELNYAPALAALGIANGDRRWGEARAMLQQVAANYRVTRAAEAEETPARQIATLKAALQGMKARAKQGMYPSPFFAHPCDAKKRHRAALPMGQEMAIATELRAIELTADPDLRMDVKLNAAVQGAIDRLKGYVSTGRPQPWPLLLMLDQLVAVADHLAPAVVVSRKRLWEFVNAFMVDALGMGQPDIEHNRSRAYKLLPDLRRRAARDRAAGTGEGRRSPRARNPVL